MLKGFFPKRMLWGDKVFFSILIICLLALFWIRFLEKYVSVWFSLLISGPISIYILTLENPASTRRKAKEELLRKYGIRTDGKKPNSKSMSSFS